jgi:ATP-dependent DNA helicase DinG
MAVPWREVGLRWIQLHLADDAPMVDLQTGRIEDPPTDRAPDLRIALGMNGRLPQGVLDLSLLARVLHPNATELPTDAIGAVHGSSGTQPALWAMVEVLDALLHEAMTLDREVLSLLARLLPSPAPELLRRLMTVPMHRAAEVRRRREGGLRETVAVPTSSREALLAEGVVAAGVARFEDRPGQREMADLIEDCFEQGGVALVDAPPGIGKTFAYLVPALLCLKHHAEVRVVISTRTRQLQEQLYRRDLPYLTGALTPSLRLAMLKGRENYLCLRRWQGLLRETLGGLPGGTQRALALLVRWVAETQTGDIEENHAFLADPEGRALWHHLCDSPYACTGRFCPLAEDCFSVLARRRARRARLVVVNHPLLLGDLSVDGVVLGKYTHLIVDEAHALESVARTAFSRQLSERLFYGFIDDLMSARRSRQGWFRRTELPGEEETVGQIERLLRRLKKQVREAFREIDGRLPSERRTTFRSLDDLSSGMEKIRGQLSQIRELLHTLSDRVACDEARQELEGTVRLATRLEDDVDCLSVPPDEHRVHWAERTEHGTTLHATPVDVAPVLEERLYPGLGAMVMTSATMSLAGSFEYLRRTLGLRGDPRPVRMLVAKSSFSYQRCMRILVPRYAPPADGAAGEYAEYLASLLGSLSDRSGRKGLVLFTSYALLGEVKSRLAAGVRFLAQGDASRTAVLQRFREMEGPSWLLGTESFWEGVDLPGEELEILVITRLPFPVPSDPVFAAQCDRIHRDGGDPFRDLAIPLATTKLRQGIGRLLRTEQDRGVVLLTDRRVLTRAYGEIIRRALPVEIEAIDDPQTLLAETAQWFEPAAGAS